MVSGLIGRKKGMSQIFNESGDLVTVTVIEVGPCVVSQIKSSEKDGYGAIQLSFENIKDSKLSKAESNHLKKKNLESKGILKEFKLNSDKEQLEVGKVIQIKDVFNVQDKIKVSAVSKGKGFQGVVKRHGFAGGPAAHGSRFHRHPGSMGANSDPSRVFKGRKLPGRMGSDLVTVRNLKVVGLIEDKNILLVSGSVPGRTDQVVKIQKL